MTEIKNDNELENAEVNTYYSNGCGYERYRCNADCLDLSAWISTDN
jgi:hypothetical protein